MTQTDSLQRTAQSTGASPLPAESPEQYRERYRKTMLARANGYQARGRIPQARELLANTIRQENWTRATLWWRLVALMEVRADYAPIRDLWMLAPAECHTHHSILRAVARAAAVSGHHDDCRVLLCKLIVLLERHNRRKHGSGKSLSTCKPGSPGPSPSEPSPDKDDFTAKATVALHDLNTAFRNIGLDAFLISGTLLGQIREGRIIGWDKDIDVGYFKEDCRIDLERDFRKSENFRVGRVDLTSDRLRLVHRNNVWIDVFPHYMENGLRWHNGTATRWWNTPFGLRKVEFIGVEQYIPDDPERYLEENYGDWRTPVSDFDARLDAPNVEITDPAHFISLLYFGVEKCIRSGKSGMLRRYISLLKERDNAGWLQAIRN